MMPCLPDPDLLAILRDDCPYSDLTTDGLGIGRVQTRAELTARDKMVVCCVEDAARMFELCGAEAQIHKHTGAQAEAGQVLLSVIGPASGIHRAYKMAQTLMEITSGMATVARAIVDAAGSANPLTRVACTRKHMPGVKRIALRAIEAGGATPHRLGLSDFVLVFDEHRVLLDPSQPLAEHLARLRQSAPERRLAVEVSNIEEAIAVAEAGAGIVQVDKATPGQIADITAAFRQMGRPPLLAAAGGIHSSNVAEYAKAGADILVTSAPYYAQPRDVKVRMCKL